MVQPPLHRGDRERKEIGDARDGPLLGVAQPQDHPVVRFEPGKGLADAGALAALFDRLGGTLGQLAALGQEQAVYLRGLSRLRPPFAPGDPTGAVPGDGAQPGRELRRLLQLRQRLEGDQKRLLRHVLRTLPPAQRLLRDQSHRAPEPAHELIEGLEVAEQCGKHDLGVAELGKAAGSAHRRFSFFSPE